MRNKLIVLLILLVILITINVNGIRIDMYEPINNVEIRQVTQYNTVINNNDLYSELLIKAVVNNTADLKTDSIATLTLEFQERGIIGLPIEWINITIWVNCSGNVGEAKYYKNINPDCKNIIFQDFINNRTNSIRREFKTTELPAWTPPPSTTFPFYIKSEYYIKDFIFTNGNYYIGWLQTLCPSCPDDSKIKRTLMLPQNTVIESWNNFKIIDMKDDSWVLEVKGQDTPEPETGSFVPSMVWYRNLEKERQDQTNRDLLVIGVSVGLTIIFGLLFKIAESKKTMLRLVYLGGAIFGSTFSIMVWNIRNPIIIMLAGALVGITAVLVIVSLVEESKKNNETNPKSGSNEIMPSKHFIRKLKRILWRFRIKKIKETSAETTLPSRITDRQIILGLLKELNQSSEKQSEFNRLLAYATGILALTALWDWVAKNAVDNIGILLFRVGLIITFVILIGLLFGSIVNILSKR